MAGVHRSGTSAIARILNLLGCDLPQTMVEARPTNPTGFWESSRVMHLNESLLASAGSSWHDWSSFNPEWYASPTAGPFRERARLLLHEEFGDSPLFVLKEPRICRLLPFWSEAMRSLGIEPQVVLPIRNPLDVAASLARRDGIVPALGHLIWLRNVLDAEVESRPLTRAWVRYEELLARPHTVVEKLGRELDIAWPCGANAETEREIEQFLSPGLRHHRSADEHLLSDPELSRWLRSTFEILERWTRDERRDTDTAVLDETRAAFNEATPIFSRAIGELDEQARETWRLTREVESMRRSIVWRMTGPLRRLKRMQRRPPTFRNWQRGRRLAYRFRAVLRPRQTLRNLYVRMPLPPALKGPLTSVLRMLFGRSRKIRLKTAGPGKNALPASSTFAFRADRPPGKGMVRAAQGPDLSRFWRAQYPYLRLLEERESAPMKTLPADLRTRAEALLGENPITVSVIIPVWNRERFVCEAVASALDQSYAPLEIIVVDDGSTDGSVRALRERFADPIASGAVKIIEKSHGGVSDARNAGLAAATGDLIAWLDSDNTWYPEYLLAMAALFAEAGEVSTAYAARYLNDADTAERRLIAPPHDRTRLLDLNFIDLNVFMHRRLVHEQNGGFDPRLKRLVDWDFILSCTARHPPVFVPCIGAEYHLSRKELANITHTVELEPNLELVRAKHMGERIRHGLAPLRLAYILGDWPALSQTFVLEELRWLVRGGHDVIVYYTVAPDRAFEPDFEIESHKVHDAEHLAELLKAHGRTLCHVHFAYPPGTLYAWPACRAAELPFTLFAHAVDIFHHANMKRNRIDEVARDPHCLKVFVHGEFHRTFLEDRGVPTEKIAFTFQASDLSPFERVPAATSPPGADRPAKGIFLGRFVEKKGVSVLLEAAAMLRDEPVTFDVHGYGPLEREHHDQLRRLGLENIRLKEPLEGIDAVTAAIREADFVVVPSMVAANGDTEGFPTVILEAMAAGRPVVTSAISAVPDHLRDMIEAILVTPGEPASLADGVRRLLSMPPGRRTAMLAEARRFLRGRVGVDITMQHYLDVWRDDRIDIFLVTYNTSEYEDRGETFEIIRRILRHTTTPFTLTIIDNGSDPDFRRELAELCRHAPNVRLVLLRENLLCGPASNRALALGDGVFAIYLCSKEAFIARHGWERALISHMRRHPEQAMAGYRTHLPPYTLGSEMAQHPDFGKFRNPEHAGRNPRHLFAHVQGGVYIIRRSVLEKHDGFPHRLPQRNTDVEFSYYLESVGERLGSVDEVASVTTETDPPLSSVLDENIVVAHPLTLDTARALLAGPDDPRDRFRCNLCGSQAKDLFDAGDACANCGSTPFGRSVYRRLAHDWRAGRGARAFLVTGDAALTQRLGGDMFRLRFVTDNIAAALAKLKRTRDDTIDLFVIDPRCLTDTNPEHATERSFWSKVFERLSPDGLLLYASDPTLFESALFPDECRPLVATDERPLSRVLRQDWRRLREYSVRRAA